MATLDASQSRSSSPARNGGILVERAGIDVDQGFERLRGHARNHNARLAKIARDLVDKTLTVDSLDPMPVKVRPTDPPSWGKQNTVPARPVDG